MTPIDKQVLKAQLNAVTALSQAVRSLAAAPIPPAISGPPGVPIILAASLNPLAQAVKTQADLVDKLIKLVDDLIEKI